MPDDKRILAFAALIAASFLSPGHFAEATQRPFVFAVVALGLICQLTGYFCLTYALGHVPATVSSVILLAVAPLTTLLAFFLFGEAMTAMQLFGGALILAAVWIITSQGRASNPGA